MWLSVEMGLAKVTSSLVCYSSLVKGRFLIILIAIRFVLSDAYTSMTREERESLLHEGLSTSNTLSAFVEIVFDNSGKYSLL